MSTDIEQQLRGAMERFTRDVRVPPGLALKAYRHQQKRRVDGPGRRRGRDGDGVAAGSVAVAGATGAFGSASRAPVQAAYTAYVVTHVEHALAASRVGNLVEADRTVFSPGSTLQPFPDGLVGSAGGAGSSSQWRAGYTLRWIYHGSIELSSFTASGQRVFDWAITPADGTTAVIYGNDTWWTAPAGAGRPGRERPCAAGCIRGHEIALGGGAGNGWPAFIRSQLACGAYTVAGRQVINGINTIKITGAGGRIHLLGEPGELPARAGGPGAAPDRVPLARPHSGQPGQAEGDGPGRLRAGPGARRRPRPTLPDLTERPARLPGRRPACCRDPPGEPGPGSPRRAASLPGQGGHAFHVVGHGERIERAERAELPAGLGEHRDVTGQRGRVTGHVGHPAQRAARAQQQVQRGAGHADPGRVEHGQAGLRPI